MDARLRRLAAQHGGVFTTADARRVEVDDPALRALIRSGDVVRVRRGAYVVGEVWAEAEHERALRLRTMAVLRSRPGDVATHQAALALHGLPLHGVRLDVVDVQANVSRPRLSSGLRTQSGDLPSVVVAGARAVRVEHAIVQVLLRAGLEAALEPLDAALGATSCSLADVQSGLALLAPERHRARGRSLVSLADPKCDSPGESRTRLLLHDLGLSWRSQVVICDEHDDSVARVDFLVAGCVVVEFNGVQQYAGADGRAALAAEKRREDRLRALGYVVVRLTWSDLAHPERAAAMLRRALAA